MIDDVLGTGLPIRLSFSQFQTNPFQHGCSTALTAASGSATVNLFQNGFPNPTVPETAEEAKLGRHDRRTIVGGRWEHDFNNSTTWRTPKSCLDKNINQPTGSTSAIGDSPAHNFISDFTSRSGGYSGWRAFITSPSSTTANACRITPGMSHRAVFSSPMCRRPSL